MTIVSVLAAREPPVLVRFGRAVRRDAAIHAIISVYMLVAVISAWIFGKNYLYAMMGRYLLYWCVVAVSVLAICGGALLVARVAEGGLHHSWRRAVALAARTATPEMAARVLLFLELAAFMGAFTTVKTMLPLMQPFWADADMAALDRALHFGHDPWWLLHQGIGGPQITGFLELCYSPIWLAVTSVLPAWMAIGCEDARLRRRFLLTFLLAWIVNGTVLAGLFMSGGPAFYGPLAGNTERFAPLLAQLGGSEGPFSAATQQQQLWLAFAASSPTVGAGISAFPSLHVTMAGLAALAGWSISRRMGLSLTAYAGVVLIGSVHLGWHYAIDGYAAVVSILFFWWVAGRLSPAEPDLEGWIFGRSRQKFGARR